jgi:hypothetical protein
MNIARYLLPIALPFTCLAQDAPPYPTDYFRNPLDIPILLAGNFGECRPGHFHSGLDIKTQGKENLPVHAAAEGYISRIKTDKGGFGHAIYITHPNGYTTLYAHLNKYMPSLQAYLRQQQYERKRWDVDIQLTPSQFPVKRGQQIAWSGNTGSSTAPHLHFEIRDNATEHPLNPQLFGLKVVDDIAPTVKEVVFYGKNVYDGPLLTATLAKKGDTYKAVRASNNTYKITGDTLDVPAGLIGIGLNVDDYMNNSENTITFYKAHLYIDGELQAEVVLDDIGYDESRYMHAYADYRTKELNKKWIQCLFKLPGNNLRKVYTQLNDLNGRANFSDGGTHELYIKITDNNNNSTKIGFFVKPIEQEPKEELKEDCLLVSVKSQGGRIEYTSPNLSFAFTDNILYEETCLNIKAVPDASVLSDRFRVHYPYIPVHRYFDLNLKPNKTIPFDLRSKVVLMYSDGKDVDGKAATFSDQGWYKASVRNFGTYWLYVDTTAPRITSTVKNGANLSKAKQITLTAKDAITSVSKFTGRIDGKWVCFEQHGSSFFYEFDEHCPAGRHQLSFTAQDENGNEATFEMNFTR